MPRQRLAPGKWGKVTDRKVEKKEIVNGKTKVVETLYYARTYVRLHSGKLREREAMSRKSAEDARRELQRRIDSELEAGEPTGVINQRTTLSELFEAWITDWVLQKRIGERTETLYRGTWRVHAEQQIGDLRIAELETSHADTHLKALPQSAGIYLRIVLVGMYGMATRYGVIKHNPMRETQLAKVERDDARALTAIEFEQVRQAVKAYCDRKGPGPRRAPMLPAFVELLAATGARPSEVLATRWADVDLLADPPTVTVCGTVQDSGRIKGKPIHRQAWRKGHAPPITVTLPDFGAAVLTALYSVTGPEGGTDGVVLTNRNGGLLALTNIRSSLREALQPHEHLQWVTPHSFRRTVGTEVAKSMGAEQAKRQLGHRQLATTEKHYIQPATKGPDTRAVLDKWASNET